MWLVVRIIDNSLVIAGLCLSIMVEENGSGGVDANCFEAAGVEPCRSMN